MSYSLKNIYAAAPQTERGAPFLITGDPKGKNFLYCCGTSVFIRNIREPLVCDQYREHPQQVVSARYSPSGFYIASGDVEGKIRIWDTVNEEHVLKFELRALSSAVRDIQWSPDSKRIIAVGDGKESFANAFMWDSGATVGTITGHSKTIMSCDFRPTRPFRIVTGGLDMQVNFYEGPPFKFHHSLKGHKRFVNCVRYSPNGEHFLSVGSDMSIILYEGKMGEQVGECENGHTGGVYGCSWAKDSARFMTCSADKTVKVWDAETRQCTATINIAERPAVEDMQLGCLWQDEWMLSVSYGGNINYLDDRSPSGPTRVLRGHNKGVNAVEYDKLSRKVYTGAADGQLRCWNYDSGDCESFAGSGHTNSVTDLKLDDAGRVVTSAMDDSVRFTDRETLEYGTRVGLDSCPNKIAVGRDFDICIAGTHKSVEVLKGGKSASSLPIGFVANCVALSADESEVVVGGSDMKLHFYSLEGTTLTEKQVVEKHRGAVTAVQYSPDGTMLASSDANREIYVWDEQKTVKIQGWCFHTSRITSLAWSPDSARLASSSVDTNVIIWDTRSPRTRVMIKGAHLMGGCNDVSWVDNNTVASVGKDCCLKVFSIE